MRGAVAIAALLTASCGSDGADVQTEQAAREAQEQEEFTSSATAEAFPEVALIEGLDAAGFELTCPPGDLITVENYSHSEWTVAGLERSKPDREPLDAVGAVTERLEAAMAASPLPDDRKSSTVDRLVVVIPPAADNPGLTPGEEARLQQAAEAAERDQSPSPDEPAEDPPTPEYPVTEPAPDSTTTTTPSFPESAPAFEYPAVLPDAEEPEPPPTSAPSEVDWVTVVAPIDVNNPLGPYLLRAEVAVIGGKYALLVERTSCGITSVPLQDQLAAARSSSSEEEE